MERRKFFLAPLMKMTTALEQLQDLVNYGASYMRVTGKQGAVIPTAKIKQSENGRRGYRDRVYFIAAGERSILGFLPVLVLK